MKRLICVLLILSVLMGCGRQVISPVQEAYASPVASAENVLTTATPSETPTPDQQQRHARPWPPIRL